MGWLEDLWDALTSGDPSKGHQENLQAGYDAHAGSSSPGTDSPEAMAIARKQLVYAVAGAVGIVAAPAIYSLSLGKGRRARKLAPGQEMVGVSLENASAQATGVLMTALAAPAITTAVAYILVQKLEDAKIITRGLGDATQGLLTVAAAGPAIQGIGGLVGSAFKKGK